MKKLLLIVSVLVQTVAAYAQLEVEAPEVVSLDEQFKVSFVFQGENSPSGFEWSQGSDFQLVWGPQQGRSTSIQIINGKRTTTSQFSYTYVLKPLKTGTFTIPAATITVKGKKYSSKAISVNVVSEGASSQSRPQSGGGGTAVSSDIPSSDLFLRMTFDKTDVVVGEPITATLKLYQRVNLAGFEDARFPSFNGFWSQEVEAPTNIEFRRESLDDRIYNVALIRKYVIVPQQAGTLAVDPAELVCLINVKTVSSGSVSIFDEFFDDYRTIRKRISTPSYKIKVSPLPSGAPASFKGGVGKLSIKAVMSKDSLVTHEAASLVVTLSGKGNISLLEAPDVVFPPDFEVYDTKVSEKTDKASGGTSGSKTYEFPFIPRSHGDFAIAPIKYTYYDVEAKRYVTLETAPIPFSVAKGEETEASAAGVVQGVSRQGVRNLNQDIRFINVKSPGLAPKGYFFTGSFAFYAIAGAIALIAVMAWALFRSLAARRADVAGTKTRKAVKMAKKRLNKAEEYLKQNIQSAFYEELHKAVVGYVADKLNMAAADFSKEKIGQAFEERGVSQELISRLSDLLDACEFARYSPDSGSAAMAEHYRQAEDIISSIDSNMKNRKKNGAAPAFLVTVALMLASMPVNAADAYVDSLWNKANSDYSQGLWQDAISTYRSVEELGLESAPLYCNIGNAYFKNKDYTMAIVYYERALKLDPSYSDAEYNLQIASDFVQDRIEPVPEFILKTWTRGLCYSVDSNTWAVIALCLFALTAAAVLVFLLAASSTLKRTGFFSAIVFLLLTVFSVIFSFWQKNDYMKADAAVIMAPVISVKSSPSDEASTDLFILHEGTKVNILDEVGDWRNIELADGRQGWIAAADLEII